MPSKRHHSYGNLYIRFDVKFPDQFYLREVPEVPAGEEGSSEDEEEEDMEVDNPEDSMSARNQKAGGPSRKKNSIMPPEDLAMFRYYLGPPRKEEEPPKPSKDEQPDNNPPADEHFNGEIPSNESSKAQKTAPPIWIEKVEMQDVDASEDQRAHGVTMMDEDDEDGVPPGAQKVQCTSQ